MTRDDVEVLDLLMARMRERGSVHVKHGDVTVVLGPPVRSVVPRVTAEGDVVAEVDDTPKPNVDEQGFVVDAEGNRFPGPDGSPMTPDDFVTFGYELPTGATQ